MNNKKLEQHLLNLLYSLNGKISKTEFKIIAKFYKWNFSFKSIHIVGTNGKGTNAKFINDELILNGYKIGLFTSPHIVSMYERIKVNNKNIEFEQMTKYVSELKADFPDINFGWFDIFFLCAIKFFVSLGVDVAIFESGIGAKKDVVNYIDHDALIITSIGEDHIELLGNTIEKIANDKSYAIKKNMEVFVSNKIDKKCIDIFKKRSKKVFSKIYIVDSNEKTFDKTNKLLSSFFLKNFFGIKEFKSEFRLPIGRVQEIKINNISCFVDVAHNLQSIEETLKYFKTKNINFDQIVISLSNDKNKDQIFDLISKNFDKVFAYQNKGRKPLLLSQYDKKFSKINDLGIFINKLSSKTLFIGSFYLVSEIFDMLDINEYR